MAALILAVVVGVGLLLQGCGSDFPGEPDDELVRLKAVPATVTAEAAEPQNDWTLTTTPSAAAVPRGTIITWVIQWTRTAEGYVIEHWAVLKWWRGGVEQPPIESPHAQVVVTDLATNLKFLLPLPEVVLNTGTVSYVDGSLKVDGVAKVPGTDPATGWWTYDHPDLPGSGSGQLEYQTKAE
jgi:hypothetical protein